MIRPASILAFICISVIHAGDQSCAENLGESISNKPVVARGTGCTGPAVSWELGGEKAREEAVNKAKQYAASRTATYVSTYNRNVDKVSVENSKQSLSIGSVEIAGDVVFSEPVSDQRGFCTTVTFNALVTVDTELLKDMIAAPSFNKDPDAFLNVRVWTDKREYRHGEKLKIFVMANKDFYLDLIYIDAGMRQVKVIPNQYRSDNRFKGGQVHAIPMDLNEFEITIDCVDGKCGKETLIATASTHRIMYDPETSGIPIKGTNIAEYKGDIRKRSIKLQARTVIANQQRPTEETVSQETAQSSFVVLTQK